MNIRIVLGIILIGLVLVLGCEQSNQGIIPVENNPPADIQPAEPQEPEPKPVETKPELSQEIKDILNKNSKIVSYSYLYREVDSVTKDTAQYYVMGDKLRIKYQKMKNYTTFNYFDIYLDTKAETANLVCDNTYECKGRKGIETDYDTFRKPTPLEVAKGIDNGEIIERTQLDDKSTVVVAYVNGDGQKEKIWIWEYWGVPLQREISVGEEKEKISYENMVVNGVEDKDISIPKEVEMS